MHKPNKIPGMKLKGIDRKRDRTGLHSKKAKSYIAEQAKLAKQAREDKRCNRSLNGTNKRTSRYNSFDGTEACGSTDN